MLGHSQGLVRKAHMLGWNAVKECSEGGKGRNIDSCQEITGRRVRKRIWLKVGDED